MLNYIVWQDMMIEDFACQLISRNFYYVLSCIFMSDNLFFIITIATAILYHEMIWQNFWHDIKRGLQELTFKGIIFNFSP